MGKYRKILVAYDGSRSSENALLQSFRLAEDEKSWITVTTVVPEYRGELDLTGIPDFQNVFSRPGKELLSRAAETARREGALIRTVLEEGGIHERIVDLAEGENCSLIVVGRRGTSSFDSTLIGSVAARVIGHSLRDVLVVPAGAKIGWGRILVATDGSKHSLAAAERAIDIGASYRGKLTALSVVDVPDELYGEAPFLVDDLVSKAKTYVKAIADSAAAAGLEAETLVREGESFRAILKIAEEANIDLIVLGSHGRTGLRRLLMGSVTEKVIGAAKCPVLVVKS